MKLFQWVELFCMAEGLPDFQKGDLGASGGISNSNSWIPGASVVLQSICGFIGAACGRVAGRSGGGNDGIKSSRVLVLM